MNNKKIIFISQPGSIIQRKIGHDSQNPEKDEFFLGRIGLAHFIAGHLKQEYPDIEIELWRIDENVKEKTERLIKSNILSKVYPMKRKAGVPYSIRFLRDLKSECRKGEVIIWFDGLHNYYFMLVSFYLRKCFQVAHNLGGDNYAYKYLKTKKIKYRLAEYAESKLFAKNIDLGIFSTATEFDYFKKYQSGGDSLLSYLVGIDTERWHIIDQKLARRRLDIPENEKMILQVGRARKYKGTHLTIEAWSKFLKKKGIKLYLTGINENDELYEMVKQSGCNYMGMIDHELFPYYMAAADVYLYPPFDDITLNFAGIGYAPLEALASGTPIVCTTAHFLELTGINLNNYSRFIKIPGTIEEIAIMTIEILNNKPDPGECSSFIIKHFTNDALLPPLLKKINSRKPNFFENKTNLV